MKKNKKVITIAIIAVIIIAAIITIVVINNNSTEKQAAEEANNLEDEGVSKLNEISEKIQNDNNYKIELAYNDENKKIISKEGESARIEYVDAGESKIYIIKDSNTYLLEEKTKKYYEYNNNVSMLNSFENDLEEILTKKYEVGTEKIDGKEYRYEEFNQISSLLINYKGNVDESTTKTRFYFDGNDLKYVKTYVGDVQQLLKVNISFGKQDSKNFEIPSDYSKE